MKTYPVEAVGNRFLLVDRRETGEHDWPETARDVCWGDDPDRAICDGLLVIEMTDPIFLRMFNPDGTEDFCGNGLLCAATYAWETCGVHKTEFRVSHLGRVVPVTLTVEGNSVRSASMLMPPPRFDPAAIPMVGRAEDFPYPIRPVSTGTAHAVIVLDKLPSEAEFRELSPRLENHPAFPERTTVDWVEPVEPGHVRIRIWERGVGETLGCGTGAAAVVATTHSSLHDGRLVVESRGGVLNVEWPGEGPIRVEGSAIVPPSDCRE